MKRFNWLLGLLVIVLLGTTVGAGASADPVRVLALSGNTGLAMVELMEKPMRQGVEYQFQVFKSPDQLIAKLINGEADIAALPTNTAAVLYNKGIGVQLTAIIGWGVLYLVGEDDSIKDIQDLQGKEVFIPAKGAVPDLTFQYIAKESGLDPGKAVRLNYAPNPVALAQMVIAGKAPLAVLPEPWVTEVLERSPKTKVLLDLQTEYGRVTGGEPLYPQTCVIVRRDFAAQHPELVKKFNRDLEAGIKWLEVNPQAGAKLAEQHVQLSAVSVEKGLDRCNLKYSEGVAVREAVADFLKRLSSIAPQAVGGKLPDEAFYYQP